MNILEVLKERGYVIFDGAMGTQLEMRGAPAGGLANIKAPSIVEEVQKAYIDAGSNVIIANTFCLCRIYADSHGIEENLETLNRAGVEIALSAAGRRAAVLGDIGPTGKMLKPLGEYTEEQFYETFLEQAKYLAAGGVHGFIIETMMDLKEAMCAVRACRQFDMPLVVSMTFATESGGGRTQMGDRAADCAVEFEKAGADVVGANCGSITPGQMAAIVASYKAAAGLPVLAQPNAGKPRLDGDRTVYDMPPDVFAAGVAECAGAGAKLLGGCCGTSPDHIRALAGMATAL